MRRAAELSHFVALDGFFLIDLTCRVAMLEEGGRASFMQKACTVVRAFLLQG